MGAEIPDGAIIVARAIVNSSLWEMRLEDRVVAITCLAIANKRAKKWYDGEKDIIIQRGQFVRSREQMAKACRMPLQRVRTSIENLENSEFLTRDLTRAYTIYTIHKYLHYQDLTKYSDSGVLKPTRNLTRPQPGKTAKSNPEFAQASVCKCPEPQEVAGLCKLCGENLTRENPKSNHKQQQHKTIGSTSSPIRGTPEGTASGGVVVQSGERRKTDPYLDKISFRISMRLLEEIKMSKAIATTFATGWTVGHVLAVVQQARLQKNPGGWAKIAFEKGWEIPDPCGKELDELIEIMKGDVDRLNVHFLSGSVIKNASIKIPPREAGEDERSWMVRVTDELKRRKEADAPGRAKEKTT
jgi:hypothetical protein